MNFMEKFLLLGCCFAHVSSFITMNPSEVRPEIWALNEKRAELPCIPENSPAGNPSLVLWYKDNFTVPIYTYDARDGSFKDGKRWTKDSLKVRAYFRVIPGPPSLALEPVTLEDEGTYVCRLEYNRSISATAAMQLLVAVMPKTPIIEWEGRHVLGRIGPFKEGATIDLTCKASGGRPFPEVTWWKRGQRLEAVQSEEMNDVTGVTRAVSKTTIILTRSFHNMPLVCHAHTRRFGGQALLVPPVTAAVTLTLLLAPLDVRVEGNVTAISGGDAVRLLCKSSGSQPPAELTWWRNGEKLVHVYRTIYDGGNVTSSSLTLKVSSKDEGATIACKASNPSLSDLNTLTDSVTLNVFYAPEVTLTPGKLFNLSAIQEGQDLYLECNAKANPPPFLVEWFFNDDSVGQLQGVIINQWNLIIQNVQRRHSGQYKCVVKNAHGRSASDVLDLSVLHTPVCLEEWKTRKVGVAKNNTTHISCRVEANPTDDLTFFWSRLLQNGTELPVPDHNSSSLSMTPQNLEDYYLMACRARNRIGVQRDPCIITLVPDGPPDSLANCTMQPSVDASYVNKTAVSVICLEGFNGGLLQHFVLEAWQKEGLLVNETSEFPEWLISGFDEGQDLLLKVRSYNARGTSLPIILTYDRRTAEEREVRVQERKSGFLPTLAGVLTGSFVVLALVCGVLVLYRSSSCCPNTRKQKCNALKGERGQFKEEPDVVTSVQNRGEGGCSNDLLLEDTDKLCNGAITHQDVASSEISERKQNTVCGPFTIHMPEYEFQSFDFHEKKQHCNMENTHNESFIVKSEVNPQMPSTKIEEYEFHEISNTNSAGQSNPTESKCAKPLPWILTPHLLWTSHYKLPSWKVFGLPNYTGKVDRNICNSAWNTTAVKSISPEVDKGFNISRENYETEHSEDENLLPLLSKNIKIMNIKQPVKGVSSESSSENLEKTNIKTVIENVKQITAVPYLSGHRESTI